MNWNDEYAVSFYATTVDPVTWSDKERFEVKDGSYVSRMNSGLRDNASLSLDFIFDKEELIRIYVDAAQNEDIAHTAVFTGYATSPKKSMDGELLSQNAPCYGVLEHGSDILLPLGWYAPIGKRATDIIRDLLPDVQMEIKDESPILANYVVAENNESCLSMTDKILNAIGWVMQVDGTGLVSLGPSSKTPVIEVSPAYDIIEEQIDIEQDMFNVCNVFRAVYGDTSAIAIDSDPNSPYSTVTRGREIWGHEEVSELAENESLALYAKRRLGEVQNIGKTARYSRRFHPDIFVGSIVAFNYDNIKGNFRVTSQKINLSHNCTTDEVGEAI